VWGHGPGMQKANKDVLNVREAAHLLGVAEWTVREQAKAGRLPGRKIGKEWRFSRQALLDFLATPDPSTSSSPRRAGNGRAR
jgi:excisionase family DNA binding protein